MSRRFQRLLELVVTARLFTRRNMRHDQRGRQPARRALLHRNRCKFRGFFGSEPRWTQRLRACGCLGGLDFLQAEAQEQQEQLVGLVGLCVLAFEIFGD